jgi:zinc finger FYVE domain-containing protein 26
MQILTGDLVRAAMTCIKFYLEGSGNYTELNAKSHHLMDAKSHLQTELEKTESKKVERHESNRKDGITLKWDLKTINTHINIIALQLEVAKYLAQCEAEGLPTIALMPKIFMDKPGLMTMFGKSQEKNQVAILLLVCGHSIESGFGISYRVIQECTLKSTKIYTTCTKYLAKNLTRLMEVGKLVESIKANAANEGNVIDIETIKACDELVSMAVEIAYNQHQAEAKTHIDQLIKLIANKNMKIQCYINSNQLKTAYMLSASLNRLDDVRRIMKQAEITRQENVRRLCEKKLFQRSSDGQSSQSSKSDINQL